MKRVDWDQNGIIEDTYDQAHLVKSQVGMEAILEYRLGKGLPLKVMRPLTYDTSIMQGQEEEDGSGFYQIRKSASMGCFVDARITIPVGTELLLKAVDVGLNEFVFIEKDSAREHSISFVEKNNLMVQTDIYEIVQKHLNED